MTEFNHIPVSGHIAMKTRLGNTLKQQSFVIQKLYQICFSLHELIRYEVDAPDLKHGQALNLLSAFYNYKSYKSLLSDTEENNQKNVEEFYSNLSKKIKLVCFEYFSGSCVNFINSFSIILFYYFSDMRMHEMLNNVIGKMEFKKLSSLSLAVYHFNFLTPYNPVSYIGSANQQDLKKDGFILCKTCLQVMVLNELQPYIYLTSTSHDKPKSKVSIFSSKQLLVLRSNAPKVEVPDIKYLNFLMSPFLQFDHNFNIIPESVNAVLAYWFTYVIDDKQCQNIISVIKLMLPSFKMDADTERDLMDVVKQLANQPYQYKVTLRDIFNKTCQHRIPKLKELSDHLQQFLEYGEFSKVFKHQQDIPFDTNSFGRLDYKDHYHEVYDVTRNEYELNKQTQTKAFKESVDEVLCLFILDSDDAIFRTNLIRLASFMLDGFVAFQSLAAGKSPKYTYYRERPDYITEKEWQILLDLNLELAEEFKQAITQTFKLKGRRIRVNGGYAIMQIETNIERFDVKNILIEGNPEQTLSKDDVVWFWTFVAYQTIIEKALKKLDREKIALALVLLVDNFIKKNRKIQNEHFLVNSMYQS